MRGIQTCVNLIVFLWSFEVIYEHYLPPHNDSLNGSWDWYHLSRIDNELLY